MSLNNSTVVADLTSFDFTGTANESTVVADFDSFNFSGATGDDYTIIQPAEGVQISQSQLPYTFDWSDAQSPDGWLIEIADNESFTSPAVSQKVVDTQYVLSSLANGSYFWRVTRLTIDTGTANPIEDDSRAGDEASLEAIYSATKGNHVPTLATVGDLPDPTATISDTDLRTSITQRSYIIGGELHQLMYLEDPAERVWRNYGEPWTNKTGWATSGMDLSSPIYGVETATINGELRVTGIDVRHNTLIGTLPEFAGLQKMEYFYVKQIDAQTHVDYINNARQGRYLYYERLTGPLPSSLGQTSVTDLSLSGHIKDLTDTDSFLLSVDGGFNNKNSRSINKFRGGIPDSWANLALEYLELNGQGEGFNGELKESVVSNWRIKEINIYGKEFNDKEYGSRINYIEVGNGWTGLIPSGVKNWVDCIGFGLSGHFWSGIALDAFEGWNDIENRSINLGYDAPDFFANNQNYFNQDLPDLSGLTLAQKLSFGNRRFGGEYPYYIQSFPNLQESKFSNHQFTGTADLITNASKPRPGRWYGINIGSSDQSLLDANLFQQDMNLGGLWENRVILFYVQGNDNVKGNLPEGSHEWYRGRYVFFDSGLSGPLPSKPPCLNSPSLRQLKMSCNFSGSIPEGYGEVGSTYDYGGSLLSVDESITNSGNVTAVGSDGTGFYIEDGSQSWTVNEFQPLTSTANGPRVLNGTSTSRVISNTATRIYFEDDLGFSVNDSFDIVNNQETDNRNFSEGLTLDNQNLSGDVPASLALKHATSGARLDIRNNNFTIDNLIGSYSTIKSMADSNGWTYLYAPQKEFGVEQTIDSFPYTIDYSSTFAEGNSYTWYKNGSVISGETGSSYTATENGDYYVEISNSTLTQFSGSNVLRSKTTTVNQTDSEI